MKLKNILRIGWIVAASGFMAACEKDFEEFNTNGNALEEVSPVYQLGEVTRDLHQSYGQGFNVGSEWQHQWARSYGDTRGYIYDEGQSKTWNESYSAYRDIVDLIEKVKPEGDESSPFIYSVALIAKIFHFHMLTDMYGDVPYSEAGMAVSGLVQASYDSQEEIYNDLFRMLDEAINILEGVENYAGIEEIDRLYDGQADAWLRFANSLRLRMGMRVRYVDASLSASEIGKALSSNLIENNDQNALIYEFESALFQKEKENMMHPSIRMVEFLENDPRYDLFFEPLVDTALVVGYENGLVITQGEFSRIGQGIAVQDRPNRVMGASEVSFLMAEAYLSGNGVSADAQKANDAYKAGIRMSMEFWGVDSVSIARYMADSFMPLEGTEEEKLEMIIMQKWVDLIDNGVETYAEGRRTGYPVIEQRQDASVYLLGETNGVMPRKCKYPESETLYNTENFKEKSSQHDFLVKVWWDKK
ncbi:SusD/RagB family nutrient-binding outer membrane lipoprotein [Aureibacter tunicatorum]|uniref:SusD/RagB family nutrient-binding outer membrane lipoprotein n=1 Tax=Aureibacter tunicatorum TaxID=866807 RepID=A0AAE3XPJ2_9BACT|nr:SusD/RagB family nutrient-binding outer membrane lipoprotein [Aureibacter tunicatorum]MDR6240333.1 hypothetical protein [Aureibacter tunicatorum]BDD05786.1 hypothetical protein AUTU_32690 [Aureibacter tunicatorum]